MTDQWFYSQAPHPIIGGHTLAEDDTYILMEQRGQWYLVSRATGNGHKLPVPLPDLDKDDLLAWAKGRTLKAILN
jgi:hypothetical protein